MTKRDGFRILVGVDGSAHARAALATAIQGPWPDSARVRAVVARQTRSPHRRSILLSALDRRADDTADRAKRALSSRWPHAEAIVVDETPVNGIIKEAKNFMANVIVVGWRGHGAARALLMGSVSRGVVRGARCAVLVVRRRPAARIRKIVLAFDASPNARRAVNLVATLSPGRNGHVTLVQAVQLVVPTAHGPAMAGIRTSIAQEVRRINAERSRAAERALEQAAEELDRNGWHTHIELRTGEPLRELIDIVNKSQAELVVVGARGTNRARHLLLGSVADGVLNRSPVPVLLAR